MPALPAALSRFRADLRRQSTLSTTLPTAWKLAWHPGGLARPGRIALGQAPDSTEAVETSQVVTTTVLTSRGPRDVSGGARSLPTAMPSGGGSGRKGAVPFAVPNRQSPPWFLEAILPLPYIIRSGGRPGSGPGAVTGRLRRGSAAPVAG
jgi:hypothetical protein